MDNWEEQQGRICGFFPRYEGIYLEDQKKTTINLNKGCWSQNTLLKTQVPNASHSVTAEVSGLFNIHFDTNSVCFQNYTNL
jgi:hypothetical protein